MFIAALCTIARTWTQPRCPSTDVWIKKLWYIYTMEYYSAIKKNAFESVLMRLMNLQPIVQSKVSQKEKDGETDIENRLTNTGRGRTARVRRRERVTWKLTAPCPKQIANETLLYNSHRGSATT